MVQCACCWSNCCCPCPCCCPAGKPLDEPILAQTVVELVHETACDSCIVWAKSDRLVSRVKVHSPGQQVRAGGGTDISLL